MGCPAHFDRGGLERQRISKSTGSGIPPISRAGTACSSAREESGYSLGTRCRPYCAGHRRRRNRRAATPQAFRVSTSSAAAACSSGA
jgi:hypothetical protein